MLYLILESCKYEDLGSYQKISSGYRVPGIEGNAVASTAAVSAAQQRLEVGLRLDGRVAGVANALSTTGGSGGGGSGLGAEQRHGHGEKDARLELELARLDLELARLELELARLELGLERVWAAAQVVQLGRRPRDEAPSAQSFS